MAATTNPVTDAPDQGSDRWWFPTVEGRAATFALVALVAVRLVAVAVIAFGPWTDEPTELAGWDAERFVTIATSGDRPWVDTDVEYPPGSVVIFEAIDAMAGPDVGVVPLNQVLVALGLAAEIVAVLLIGRRVGQRAAVLYLLVGLPLVPMGYLRLDLLTATMGLVAVLALTADRSVTAGRALVNDGLFAAAVVAGAAIKLWPAVLVGAAVALGRRRAAVLTVILGAAAAAWWLAWAGVGLSPVEQVVALRGATGWHVESPVGALVALVGDERARFELNAYRIGRLEPAIVTVGRLLSLGAMIALVALGRRSSSPLRSTRVVGPDGPDGFTSGQPLDVAAPIALGSVAALLVGSPLLSPQFLLWIVPFVALLRADRPGRGLALIAGSATTITGVTLALFGPGGLDTTVPALALVVRNLLLILIVVGSGRALVRLRTPAG